MGDMMAKRSAFLDIIKEKGALVLDGALGTELELRSLRPARSTG